MTPMGLTGGPLHVRDFISHWFVPQRTWKSLGALDKMGPLDSNSIEACIAFQAGKASSRNGSTLRFSPAQRVVALTLIMISRPL